MATTHVTVGGELPSDPREAFDKGYAAGMSFAAYWARQCGLDVDLTNPFEVMRAAQEFGNRR